jgi:hypothetical protein
MNRVSIFTSAAFGCLLIFALAGPAWAANQRAVSFGTTLPSNCFTGDLFFKTNAPAGANVFACVSANTWVVQGLATLGGDLSGQPSSATVTQIQGRPVATIVPQGGQSLTWNSSTSRWEPQTVSGGTGATTLSGDVVGPSGSNTVTQLQGRAVASTVPQGGQSLTWNSSTSRWEPQTVSGGTGATTLAGDVVGPAGTNTVTQIQGHAVVSTIPTAGQALVWNGATTRWEPQTISTGGTTGGGASMAAQLGDLAVTLTSSSVLTIGPNCAFTTPCNVRFGALTYSLTSPVTATLSSGTGNAYFYIASSGTLTVGHNLVVSCSGSCIASTGISSFPADALPLFLWHATNGTWDSSGSDQRAFLATKDVIPGTGMMTTELSGHTTLGADPSVISLRTSVPSTSGTACTAGAWATDTVYYYLCVSQNSWRRATLSSW